MGWLLGLARKHPERLLSLLIRAREIDRYEGNMTAAFRAGLKVGLDHPELAQKVLKEETP